MQKKILVQGILRKRRPRSLVSAKLSGRNTRRAESFPSIRPADDSVFAVRISLRKGKIGRQGNLRLTADVQVAIWLPDLPRASVAPEERTKAAAYAKRAIETTQDC